ncbi:MAG TPA: hypothetical protein VI488_07115 [Candidatus Angelobacter sp.]
MPTPTPTPAPSPTPSPTPTPSTTVTVTFINGTPLAVATQVRNGSFTSATPGSQVTLMVPNGTTTYAIAFLCPTVTTTPIFNFEIVVESTIQDATSLTENCLAPPNTGAATGNVSSSIPGTAGLEIRGPQNTGTNINSASGSFSAAMPVGQNDVAVTALDSLGNVLGAKILRSQTVPGTIGGSGITLAAPNDATTTQSVTIANVPAGFASPSGLVIYHTPNGTAFTVSPNASNLPNPTPYAVVPAASTQAGDFYQYFTSFTDLATGSQLIGAGMTTTSGAGAVTLTAPVPWTYSGPVPANLPTFTYNYSGFTGFPTTLEDAEVSWPVSATTTNEILVTATANFLNGATIITIPDLSGVSGFLTPAPSGTTIGWFALILGGNPQAVVNLVNPPANASGIFVRTGGQFTQP